VLITLLLPSQNGNQCVAINLILNTIYYRMEKVNIRSLRTIAKIVGTLICVCGALSIALLKGPKLLNAENIVPTKSIMAITSGSDESWLLGCMYLLGSSVAWSLWLILQVFMSISIAYIFFNRHVT